MHAPYVPTMRVTTILSPRFSNPPRTTLHNIPLRPCIAACKPGLSASICSHGSHTALTCNSTPPICSRCPIANPLTSKPSVVTFSRTIPGASSNTSNVYRSISKICRLPCGRAWAHPSKPTSSSARASFNSSIGSRRFGTRNKWTTVAIAQSPAAEVCCCGFPMSLR
jgi:hypothetical protein